MRRLRGTAIEAHALRTRSRIQTIALVFAAGCVPALVAVELPEPAAARAMIAAVESGGSLSIEAFAIEGGAPDRPFLRTYAGDARVTILYYDAPLSELGLAAGALVPATELARVRPLPEHDRAYTAMIAGDAFDGWEELPALPALLAEVRIAPPADACRPFEVVPIDLVARAERAIAAPLDAEHALVAFPTEGRLFEVDAAGHGVEHPIPEDFLPTGATGGAEGVVWFASGNTLRPWTRGQGFGEVHTEPTGTELGLISGGAEEMYSIGWNGELFRFDGAEFTRIAGGTASPIFAGAGHGIAWSAPGTATAVIRESNEVFETRRSAAGTIEVTRTEWPILERGLAATVGELELFGVVIATRFGRFYRRSLEEGAWRELPYGPFETEQGIGKINAMIDLPPRSFLFAGHYDFVVEYDREAGLCPPSSLGLELDVRWIVPLGDGWLVAGAGIDRPEPTWLVTAMIRRSSP